MTLTHVVLTIVFIGYATYWNYVWAAGSVAYAAAFACFGPVAARADPKQEATLRCAFWHKVGRNGCHEDFHNLLFVADACYLANAILNAATCR